MEHKDALTPLESRLVECAAAGEELDSAPTGATAADFDQIDDWEERKIRADVIGALCTGEVSDWSVHPRRGLRLRGAYITGQIDLSRAQLSQCPLAFHTCCFEEDVVLNQATTTDLSFTSCALPSLYGAESNSSASLRLTKTHLCQMSFSGASFRGEVELSEVRLINPEGIALSADSVSASRVYLSDAHVEGEVNLSGADINGPFVCDEGTKLINPGGYALRAELVRVASVALLRDTYVEGEVYLGGAHMSSQLGFTEGTKLINPEGTALNADSVSAGGAFLSDAHVEGEVNLMNADINGPLGFTKGTKLINPEGTALNAQYCQVGGSLHFLLGEAAVGEVNFSNAQIGTLDDNLASWPDTYNLVGFSYHSLGLDENPERRLRWISNSKPFSPHVYSQLAEVYRRSGHESLARRVAIKREKERGQQPDLSWWVRASHGFLGLTVAYGYQPWRALLGLVVLFLLGWWAFSLPAAQQVMVHAPHNITGPISATACHKNYPCFFPPVYALDTLLPIVDLHQESNWVPASHRTWGVWYEVLTWVLIAAGWILTTAVVAGIGSLWRRE